MSHRHSREAILESGQSCRGPAHPGRACRSCRSGAGAPILHDHPAGSRPFDDPDECRRTLVVSSSREDRTDERVGRWRSWLVCRQRSRTTRTGSRCSRTASPSWSTTATGSLVQAGAGNGSRFPDEEYAAAGADRCRDGRRGVRRCRPDREGEGADPGGVPPLPRGPAAVHLPAPGRRPAADRVPDREEDRLDRVRDGADRGRQAAAADPDERGRRPDGGAGRRPRPGEPGRRRRHPARRRARHPGGEGHHHRRRGLRHRGRQDRARHAGHRPGLRHQPEPAGLPVRRLRRPAGPGHPEPDPAWPRTSPSPTW